MCTRTRGGVAAVLLLATSAAGFIAQPPLPRAAAAPALAHRRALIVASVPQPPSTRGKIAQAASEVRGFLDRRFFLVGVAAAVGLAALAPTVGRRGGLLRPELTVAWGCTCGIFLLAGVSLPVNPTGFNPPSLPAHAGFNRPA